MGFPPGTDLFQLLWCPMDHVEQGYGPRVRAFWRAAGRVTAVGPTPVPGRGLPGFLPGECRIDPDRVDEIPDLRELGEERAAAIDAWLREHWGLFGVPGVVEPATDDDTPYLGEIAATPVSKVGGHPAWIQDPVQRRCTCGRDMEYLLTLASSDADPSRWRAGDGADEGSALDRSMRSLLAASLGGDASAADEATSPEEAQAVVERALASNPSFLAEVRALLDSALDGDADSVAGLSPATELMLGDLGSVYVFVCRHCEASPVDADLQMT